MMMGFCDNLSNLPPGVSGNEPQIAGEPDYTKPQLCPHCGAEMAVDWEGDPNVICGTRDVFVCPTCGLTMTATDAF